MGRRRVSGDATAVEEASSYLDMEKTRLIVAETDIIFDCSPSS